MKLHLQQVLDYVHCPMFYRFRYRSAHAKSPYLDMRTKYEEDIHKFMYAYHSHLQNGDAVDASTVKRIWGSLWIGEKNKQDLIFTDTGDKRDTWNNKRKQGIENLITYHLRGKYNIGTPVLVNHEFTVEIRPGVELTGSFELIQELQGKVELINFFADTKKMTNTLLGKDLEITAQAYAFRKIFGTKEDRIIAYYVDKNQRKQTIRTKDDEEIFLDSVYNIAVAIKNDLFYIAPSTKCISCVYKEKCDNFLSRRNLI